MSTEGTGITGDKALGFFSPDELRLEDGAYSPEPCGSKADGCAYEGVGFNKLAKDGVFWYADAVENMAGAVSDSRTGIGALATFGIEGALDAAFDAGDAAGDTFGEVTVET